jgi:zinc transport system substrate-binding protein
MLFYNSLWSPEMRLSLSALAVLPLTAVPAAADVPRVAADIAPVHSLVAQVMGDLGEPALIVRPGASPHGYALRPSEAAAVQEADLVVWIGPRLAPWLDESMATLAPDAARLTLMEVPGTVLLETRAGATFERHSHAHDAHDHDHDDHDDHDDHAHDHDHDDHAHDHDHDHAHDDHAHDHGLVDAHLWLDPENAQIWLDAIAGALAAADPDNAATYAANAAAARERLDALTVELAAQTAPLADLPFIVFHDAYQYFENRFGLQAAGAISLSDATDPSAARVAELRDRVAELGAACVLAEPQFDPGIVAAIADGDTATGVIDPLGTAHDPGPDLYAAVLRDLAAGLAACR